MAIIVYQTRIAYAGLMDPPARRGGGWR